MSNAKPDVSVILGSRNGSINAGKVTAAKIGTGAVTETKIGTGAVTAGKIGTGAVTETKLGALAVTEGKLGAGAVTEAKLGALAVTEAKLGAGAVTEAKIGAGAVSAAKLADAALKYTGFTGVAAAGPATLTGAKVGDVVAGVVNLTDGGDGAALFETAITVADQIQQVSASDLHLKNFAVLLIRKGT